MPPPVDSAPGERIAKLLARAGVASRREIERMIAEGRIARDGVVLSTPATLLPSLAGVTVDGAPVAQAEPARLFLYHKPTGLLVTERDPRGRPTIYDRLPRDLPRVVPVGRLDLNTEGLLLLTTDGGLKRQLELPATGVERSYRARAYGPVTQAQLEALIDGVEIDGIRYGPIDANLERRTGANVWIELTLTEGKNREVRRVLEHLGLQVGRLIRTRYGPFVLGDLPPGEVGEVRQADLDAFRRTLGIRRKDDIHVAIEPIPFRRDRGEGQAARRGGKSTMLDVPTRQTPTRPQPHPGVGRGPAAADASRRDPLAPSGKRPPDRAASPRKGSSSPAVKPAGASASQLGPGLRRGGPVPADAPTKPRSGIGAGPERANATSPGSDTRPAKLERKPGWARPKPKPGPARPRRPR